MISGLDSRIACVFFANFVSTTAFSICAPFLPLEFERKGIAGSYVGIIFSLYAVGYILWPPIISKYAKTVSTNTLISLSLGLMGVEFICFGFIEVLESRVNILALASILRLLHGISCSTCFTTSFLIITN